MKRCRTPLVGALAIVMLFAFAATTLAAPVVSDSCPESEWNGWEGGLRSHDSFAQSFTAIAGTLDSAKFYISNNDGAVGNVYADLYEITGTHGADAVPIGPRLATSAPVEASTITTNWTPELVTFSFDNSVTLTAGRHYAIALRNEASTEVYLWAGLANGHAGNSSYTSQGAWYADDGFFGDIVFYVYENVGTPVSVDIGGEYGDTMMDTYLYSYKPAGFFGNSTANFVGATASGEERTVLSIPLDKLEDVDVDSATLNLTKSNGTLFPLRAYRLLPELDKPTWNEYAAGSSWGTAGAKAVGADYSAEESATSATADFDVTALLEAAIADGEDTLDLVIVDPTPVARRYTGFYSSECVYAPWRPCLEVEGTQLPE